MKFLFSSGRRAEVEASDRLALLVDSSEAPMKIDLTSLKRNKQNFSIGKTSRRNSTFGESGQCSESDFRVYVHQLKT